uniref:Uncharacterized protein n=1 Tax=Arundo donax TaxID=35708 RepID=A0A0A9BP27_ARUDO
MLNFFPFRIIDTNYVRCSA